MGHDDPRLRRPWFHGFSAQGKASDDGRLIHDHRGELKAAFGRLFHFGRFTSRRISLWDQTDVDPALIDVRAEKIGRPVFIDRDSEAL
jgi:hypothetical protein